MLLALKQNTEHGRPNYYLVLSEITNKDYQNENTYIVAATFALALSTSLPAVGGHPVAKHSVQIKDVIA